MAYNSKTLSLFQGSLVLTAIAVSVTNALVGHDCYHEDATQFSLDLTEVEPCPKPETRYSGPFVRDVQILQSIDNQQNVDAYRCHIVVSKEITRCWFDSITYASEWPVNNLVLEISEAECVKAYQTESFQYQGIDITIPVDRSYSTVVLTKGEIEEGGKCTETADFKYGDTEYGGYYEYSYFNIIVEKIEGLYHRDTEQIIFHMDKNDHLRFKIGKETGRDLEYGTFVWKRPAHKCTEDYSEITRQEVEFYPDLIKEEDIIGDLVMVRPKEGETNNGGHAGLKLIGRENICGRECFSTHVETILVCMVSGATDTGIPTKFRSNFSQLRVGEHTATSYRHFDSRLIHARRHTDLYKALCAQNTLIQKARLNEIADGNQHAVNELYGPGYRSVVLGEQTYIRHCKLTQVQLSPITYCTNEIPVRRFINGTLSETVEFLDPISRIFVDAPRNITCSKTMSVKVKIDGFWRDLSPISEVRHQTPIKLNVTSHMKDINEVKIVGEAIGTLGIYTEGQRSKHEDYLFFQESRSAIEHDLVQTVLENTNKGNGLGSPLNVKHKEEIRKDITGRIFGIFSQAFEYWRHFGSFVLLCTVLRIIIDAGFRFRMAIKIRGAGWWMFSIIFTTLFNLLLLEHNMRPLIRREILKLREAARVKRDKKSIEEEAAKIEMKEIRENLKGSTVINME